MAKKLLGVVLAALTLALMFSFGMPTCAVSASTESLKIVAQPTDVCVSFNDYATVSVEAEGSGLQYQWYCKDAEDEDFIKTACVEHVYSLKMDSASHGSQVYCVVSDELGNQVVSDMVRLSVKATILKQPESTQARDGMKVKVVFEAIGDDITYTWYHKNAKGKSFEVVPDRKENTYGVTMAAKRDGRQMYCVITDKYGNTVTTDIATISMDKSVYIVAQPTMAEAMEGETARVYVEAKGDGLTYEWYYKGQKEDSFQKVDAIQGDTFTKVMDTKALNGQVYCEITDQYGNVVTSNVIDVLKVKDYPRVEIGGNRLIALICAGINIIILVFCFVRKKSLFYPVCLLNLMWLAVHVLNVILGWNSGEVVYLILALPPLCFSVGFFLTDRTTQKRVVCKKWKQMVQHVQEWFRKKFAFLNRLDTDGRIDRIQPIVTWLVLLAVSAVFVLYIFEFAERVEEYFRGNLWYTLHTIARECGVNDISLYKYTSTVAFLMPSILLICAQKSKKGIEWVKFLIGLIIAVVWSVLRTSRTSTFSVIIIMAMSQILLMEIQAANNLNPKERAAARKKRIIIFAAAAGFIMALFLAVALKKNRGAYGEVSTFDFFVKSIANYTNLSSAAFVEWYKRRGTYAYGTNSFRFIIAVLYKLGIITTVPAANYGGLFISFEGLRSNAFTVARAYVEDFGVVYMALMMTVFGLIHGAVYKKARTSDGLVRIRYALINAMLDIPLFFQILTNQYLNVLSGWIQYVFWIYVFTSSVLWIRKIGEENNINVRNNLP